MRLIDADELEVHKGTIDDWATHEFVYKDDIDDAPTIEVEPQEKEVQRRIGSVLDKIRAEIEEKYGHCDICEYFEDYDYEDNNISEYRYVASVKDILQVIDKYKTDKKDCTTCIGFGDKDYAQSFCHDCVKDIQNHYKAESEK